MAESPTSSPSSRRTNRNSGVSTLSEDYSQSTKRLGILSQTLAPSPHVRWILPARIRSRHHNDVVFIGESCIQLREFLSNGQLADATARLNIGTQIMAAKVISAKFEKIPTVDAVLDQIWDEERFLINGEPCRDDQPPQIVVLCTAASELIYTYAKHTGGSVGARFVFAKRSILHGVSMPTNYGRHMAIDRDSKTLAVASSDACAVFSVKQVDALQESIDSWHPRQPASFQPNKEQRFLPIDGTILRMEFLRSSEDDPHRVFLMFIVARDSDTRLLLYKWDSREPLITIEPMRCSGYTFPRRDSFPILLIPSIKPLSFFIVTETEMVTYDNVRSTNVKRIGTQLPADHAAREKPPWIQWARPSRHEQYEQEKEDIMLMREDGMTRIFSRTHKPAINSVINFNPGDLKMRIDTAVCMLPGPRYMGGDILIVGGVGSDGGVFHLMPRQLPLLLQSILNVSPLHDMVVLNNNSTVKGQEQYRTGRTYVLSDSYDGERLDELRLGLEAQIGWTLPLEDSAAIDRLWALEQPDASKLYFVVSDPEQTVVVEFDLQTQELETMTLETCPGFNFNLPTLAAANLASGNIVQITLDSINVITTSTRQDPPRTVLSLHGCVSADIDASSGLFVAACSTEDGYQLKVGIAGDSKQGPSIVMAPQCKNLALRPLSLHLAQLHAFHALSIGYFDGSAQVFILQADKELDEIYNVRPLDIKGAGISSIIILSRPGSSHALMLTGSQNGILNLYDLDLSNTKDARVTVEALKPTHTYVLGSTAVAVTSADYKTESCESALISCGTRVGRLKYLGNGSTTDFVLDNVWITDRSDPSYDSPYVYSMHRVRNLQSNNEAEPSGLLMCATKDEILFTSLLEQEQMVPRNLTKCPAARRFEYSKYLKKFIVASNGQLASGGNSGQPASLHLVHAETNEPKQKSLIPIGTSEEQVKALVNWSPSDGATHYELIVIGLTDDHGSRVAYANARKLTPGDTSRDPFRTVLRLGGKEVHALCAFGMASLLVSTASQIMLLRLDLSTKKFRQVTTYDLPSPAHSLSSRGSFIYAATQKHSMMVLRVRENGIEKVFAERAARNSRHVVPFGQDARHVLVSTVSHAGTSISGYIDGSGVSDKPTPSFEANVSLPVDHLRPIDTTWSHERHFGFQGSTLDGTIYLFKTLEHGEWKLLHFLERLAHPDVNKPVKRISLLTKQMARTWVNAPDQDSHVFDPKNMHIKGDILQRLIEEGPYDLRRLLGTDIKLEDEGLLDTERVRYARFETLARPIIGQTADPVAAVVAWVRRLLRSSAS